MEAGGRGGELVAQGVVLHVDADQVVQTRCGETEDARYFLSVEQVGGLVPVNPHTTEVVAEQVVQGIAREEAEAVGDPVCLLWIVVEVGLDSLSQIANGLGPLLVGARPDTERNTVQSVGGILLQNKRVMYAVRLASASANLDIVREACLQCGLAD